MNAGRLAVPLAKIAVDTLRGVDDRPEPGVTGQESQQRADRTHRIAISPTVSPCQHHQHHKGHCRHDQHGQALHPHVRLIKGIAVRPLGHIGQRIVPPTVKWREQVGRHTPVSAVGFHQSGPTDAAGYRQNDERHQHGIAQPGQRGKVAETVLPEPSAQTGHHILEHAQRAYHGTIQPAEHQRQQHQPRHHRHVQSQQRGDKLNLGRPPEPKMPYPRKIEKQHRDQEEEDGSQPLPDPF